MSCRAGYIGDKRSDYNTWVAGACHDFLRYPRGETWRQLKLRFETTARCALKVILRSSIRMGMLLVWPDVHRSAYAGADIRKINLSVMVAIDACNFSLKSRLLTCLQSWPQSRLPHRPGHAGGILSGSPYGRLPDGKISARKSAGHRFWA